MIKKIFFTLLFYAFTILSIGQQVFINPNHTTVDPGELFTTTIDISNVTNLGSFEVYLEYDPQVITAQSLILGDFLGSTGRTLFPLLEEINNETGTISYAITTLGQEPPGPDGGGVLLEVNWQANEEIEVQTITDLIIESLQITEPDGSIIDAETTDGIVEVSGLMESEIGDVSGCPGLLEVPINIIGFQDIIEFSLAITYSSQIDFESFTNPAFSGINIDATEDQLIITYNGSAQTIIEESLISLNFLVDEDFAGQAFQLEWQESDCHYYQQAGEISSNYEDGEILTELFPANANQISGLQTVCSGMSEINYETTAIENATTYIWELLPEEAGEVINNGLSCLINYTEAYSGEVQLSVSGQNACGQGNANYLPITILQNPILDAGDNDTICENENYSTHPMVENFESLLWETTGDGSFENPELQETDYFPGENDMENGYVFLKLTAYPNAPCVDVIIDSLLLSINKSITEIELPNGPTEVDIHFTPYTQYYTNSDHADQYLWHLTPPNSGELFWQQNQAQIQWDAAFSGQAKLWVTASNTCNELTSDTLFIQVENSVGVENLNTFDFKVYPNPAREVVYVRFFLKKSSNIRLEIYDIYGKLVSIPFEGNEKAGEHQFELDQTGMSNGVYLLHFILENELIEVVKVIKEN